MAVEYRRHPQHPLELRKIREWVKDANSILEIGSRFGDNLVFLAVSMAGNKLVAVDLPGAEGGVEESFVRLELKNNRKKLVHAGYDVDLILGDSHHPDTLKKVASHGMFDVVFIDGDHSYEGVKMDWEMYGPLGRMVIFHDVVGQNEVRRFWNELNVDREEYLGTGSKMGIGRVWNTAKTDRQ